MTKTKTDNSSQGTTTVAAPEGEKANVVGESCPPISTKSKEVNGRMVPASYKEGHTSLRYSPKDPPISDSSTDNK
jgi:hypothetical protein